MSSSSYPSSSKPLKQFIRPRASEINSFLDQDEDFHKHLQGDGGSEFVPSAKSVRAKPPKVGMQDKDGGEGEGKDSKEGISTSRIASGTRKRDPQQQQQQQQQHRRQEEGEPEPDAEESEGITGGFPTGRFPLSFPPEEDEEDDDNKTDKASSSSHFPGLGELRPNPPSSGITPGGGGLQHPFLPISGDVVERKRPPPSSSFDTNMFSGPLPSPSFRPGQTHANDNVKEDTEKGKGKAKAKGKGKSRFALAREREMAATNGGEPKKNSFAEDEDRTSSSGSNARHGKDANGFFGRGFPVAERLPRDLPTSSSSSSSKPLDAAENETENETSTSADYKNEVSSNNNIKDVFSSSDLLLNLVPEEIAREREEMLKILREGTGMDEARLRRVLEKREKRGGQGEGDGDNEGMGALGNEKAEGGIELQDQIRVGDDGEKMVRGQESENKDNEERTDLKPSQVSSSATIKPLVTTSHSAASAASSLSPSRLRSLYFPNEPSLSPGGKLDWILASSTNDPDDDEYDPRTASSNFPEHAEKNNGEMRIGFDLQGNPYYAPSHHPYPYPHLPSDNNNNRHEQPFASHAEHHPSLSTSSSSSSLTRGGGGSLFTLEQLLGLTRSQVTRQRAVAFEVGGKVIGRFGKGQNDGDCDDDDVLMDGKGKGRGRGKEKETITITETIPSIKKVRSALKESNFESELLKRAMAAIEGERRSGSISVLVSAVEAVDFILGVERYLEGDELDGSREAQEGVGEITIGRIMDALQNHQVHRSHYLARSSQFLTQSQTETGTQTKSSPTPLSIFLLSSQLPTNLKSLTALLSLTNSTSDADFLPRGTVIKILAILIGVLLRCGSNVHEGNNTSTTGKTKLSLNREELSKQIFNEPELLESIRGLFIERGNWPPTTQNVEEFISLPSSLALIFFYLLIASSREIATNMVKDGHLDGLGRFIAIPPWSIEEGEMNEVANEMLLGAFEIWTALGRYGIGSGVLRSGREIFERIEERFCSFEFVNHFTKSLLLKDTSTPTTKKDEIMDIELFIAWTDLKAAWTLCAIDPHATEPEHDVVWIQVEELAQGAIDALVAIDSAEDSTVREKEDAESSDMKVTKVRVIRSLCGLLSRWMEGSKINKPRKGETEREWLINNLKRTDDNPGVDVENSVISILPAAAHWSIRHLSKQSPQRSGVAINTLISLIQLSKACNRSFDLSLLPSSPADLLDLAQSVVLTSNLSFHAGWALLSVELLNLLPDPIDKINLFFQGFRLLRKGDEAIAAHLLDWLPSFLYTTLATHSIGLNSKFEVPSVGRLSLLIPFVKHHLGPDFASGRYITSGGSSPPSPKDLRRIAMLIAPSKERIFESRWWMFAPLDELLRSGNSTFFSEMPEAWDANEFELARAGLVMARVQELCRQGASEKTRESSLAQESDELDGSFLLFDLMKIFMLEKTDQPIPTGIPANVVFEEVFRDEAVTFSMRKLIEPFTLGNLRDKIPTSAFNPEHPRSTIAGLELAGSDFLGQTPFFQFYTDLIGLFDSISFSHRIFAQLLLPPLATNYAIDYRRLLWGDYSHMLRSVQVSLDQLPLENSRRSKLAEFLFPIERDQIVLRAYVEGLASGRLTLEMNGFLYFIAVHHVASNLWLKETYDFSKHSRPVKDVTVAMLSKAPESVIRHLFSYRIPTSADDLREPPTCFEEHGQKVRDKFQALHPIVNETARSRLSGVLKTSG